MQRRRKIKTAMLNGVKYKLDLYAGFDGICTPPDGSCQQEIALPHALSNTRNSLIALCHELLHTIEYSQPEAKIEYVGEAMGRYLWLRGWRLRDDAKGGRAGLKRLRWELGILVRGAKWPEATAEIAARDIGLALWRVGYRRKG